jgi:hypothetical protein
MGAAATHLFDRVFEGTQWAPPLHTSLIACSKGRNGRRRYTPLWSRVRQNDAQRSEDRVIAYSSLITWRATGKDDNRDFSPRAEQHEIALPTTRVF